MSLSDIECEKLKEVLTATNNIIKTKSNLLELLNALYIDETQILAKTRDPLNYRYPVVVNIMEKADLIARGSLAQQNELMPMIFKIIDAIYEKTVEFENTKNVMPLYFDALQGLNDRFAQLKIDLEKKLKNENFRSTSMIDVTLALNKIKNKVNSANLPQSFLKKAPQHHNKTAKNAANELCNYMEELIDAYKNKEKFEGKKCNLEQFKFIATYILGNEKQFNACANQNQFPISESMKEQRENADLLKTHRSYEVLIKNLLLAIISIPLLGVPYGIGVAITRRLSVFAKNTDTGDKIDDLLNVIDNTNDGPKI